MGYETDPPPATLPLRGSLSLTLQPPLPQVERGRKEALWQRWITFWSGVHWAAALLIFLTAGWWWRPRWIFRYPDWLVDERLTYQRFGFFPILVIALLAWGLTGFRGVRRVLDSGNMLWAMVVILLVGWARLSYGADTYKPDVALSAASQLAFVMAFALSLLSNTPPKSWVITALSAGMVFLALIAIGQSAVQSDLNLRKVDEATGLGLYIREFTLDPQRSGVSVVQSDGVRYLRSYGLTAHPNLLAGTLVMGLCASFAFWLKNRAFASGLIALGLWALLLTFSRAALGGFAVGVGTIFVLWVIFAWRRNKMDGVYVAPTNPTVGMADRSSFTLLQNTLILLGCTILFFLLFHHPLLFARAGLSSEGGSASVEAMSTAARAVYVEQAWTLLENHPWRGVGIGNFAWHSARLLQFDWRDLRGDHVHQIYLLVLVETGSIGLILYLEALIGGAFLLIGRAWRGLLELESVCLFGGVVAWLAIGWFDHYPVTQMGYQLLFWGSFAVALNVPSDTRR